MSAAILVLVAIFIFVSAYFSYGNFLEKKFLIDEKNETPAHANADGVDYIPAKKPVLFGHHFASIAGVGPIVGPVLAVMFGWTPVYLWILIGAVFFGGVHDYSSMVASIRHKGKSIGAILEIYMGEKGKRFFLIFTWATLILVIAVFMLIITKTFVSNSSVGSSSVFFIFAALIFGLLNNKLNVPLVLNTILGIILLSLSVYLGMIFKIELNTTEWMIILLLYITVASVVPVWILLQPRDYLNSFFLYAILGAGLIGVFFSDISVQAPAITNFTVSKLGFLFPALFVTVACGAISGFHSIVSSGTTAKQLDNEKDAKFIGYGGMLLEGLLAVLAMLSVTVIPFDNYSNLLKTEGPVGAFSDGVANFLVNIPLLNLNFDLSKTFIALGVAAFALTTLDTSTRLARYIFQEFFESDKQTVLGKVTANRYFATLITVIFAALLTLSGKTMSIWPVFGSANQLLASLALLAVTVWFASKKESFNFSFIPTVFMFLVTMTALAMLFYNNIFVEVNLTLGFISILLLILALLLLYESIKIIFAPSNQTELTTK